MPRVVRKTTGRTERDQAEREGEQELSSKPYVTLEGLFKCLAQSLPGSQAQQSCKKLPLTSLARIWRSKSNRKAGSPRIIHSLLVVASFTLLSLLSLSLSLSRFRARTTTGERSCLGRTFCAFRRSWFPHLRLKILLDLHLP